MSFTLHASDPSEALETCFHRIRHERMADVPLLNPALHVEAVDLQRWQGHWLGVLVTPWCMSLVLVPGQAEGWQRAGDNQRRFIDFPSGRYAFLDSDEAGFGHFQTCPLFSPMTQFASQAEAVATARAALVALLQPLAQTDGAAAAALRHAAAPSNAASLDVATAASAEAEAAAPVSLSRRRFFAPFLRNPRA